MQTTTPNQCQTGVLASKPKRNYRLKTTITCEVCGKVVHPTGRKQTTCSFTCGQRLNGQKRFGKLDKEKCATCHALVGISGTESGRLVNLDRGNISTFRKKAGLPTYSQSERRKRLNELSGKVGSKKERNNAWWRDNWANVVDSYWNRCDDILIAQMFNDEMRLRSRAMVAYYLNHSENKKKSADNAKDRYNHSRLHNPSDLLFVKKKLRNHISRVCRKSKTGKTRKTIEYLGCDINQARQHIQSQFKEGMNWNNHGTLWEIDHIVPMSHFDLSREDQRLIVNHYTNLKPEFKSVNRMKGDRLIETHQLYVL